MTTSPPRAGLVLRLAPALTVAAFALPVAAGLAGTLLPAFGWLPALGGKGLSLAPWRALFDAPGFTSALALTLRSGWTATVLAVVLALSVAALLQRQPAARRVGRALAPLLAMPHSALAIALAFVISPSGWLARWVSPGLTGWDRPPDVSTIGDPSGWPIVVALLLKEVPYLLLMTLAALNQVTARRQVSAAQTLGYGPVRAWFSIVLPQLLPQIRLPIWAVLAFSLSVVDVALILGPGNPPTLAVLVLRWVGDPDPQWVFPASAAAVLLLVLVAFSLMLWHGLERLLARWALGLVLRGRRERRLDLWPAAARVFAAAATLLSAMAVLTIAGLVLWSFAAQWRWPDAWPSAWSPQTWNRQSHSLAGPVWTTLGIAIAATLIAAVLVLACLENEQAGHGGALTRSGRASGLRAIPASQWLLYLPLLIPQVAFLFGLQVLLVRLKLDGLWLAVVAAHLVFVLPYLFLSLSDPWRAFDPRYTRSALSLGASPWRVFWRIKLPILRRPLAAACAVAFAVSAGLYLPTLFAGGGRVATLTTEAVTLSSGADRRVIATWALLQALFPMLAYAAVVGWPTRGDSSNPLPGVA